MANAIIDPTVVADLLNRLPTMDDREKLEVLGIIEELEKRQHAEMCRNDLIEFCKHIDPEYIVAAHHRKLANLLMDIADGKKDRIAVSVPPRHGKSHLVSTMFPAWYLGKFPNKKVIMVSNTTDLAVDFGRKVRNIIADPRYSAIFPTISLSQDSKSAGRWSTNHNGEYFATGVGSALAGRGADLLLIDDPHDEQDLLAGNFDALEKAYQWFTFGARTRLMSQGKAAIIHTRWHQDDLIGRLVRDSINNVEADQYEIFEFPAILPSGRALWPEKFDLTALGRTKASMAAYQWNAQYMQAPSAEEAALVKREWWMPWKEEDPPRCDYIIMALDAAAESHNRADFTAITTWGVFSDDKLTDGASHLILLNAVNVRVEFPELKELALREYKEWEPDAFIVEKKSAGTQLYQELRRIGVPVQEFTPGRNTGDKIARINAISDIIRSGMVWYPEGRRWAEQVIEQCVAFPYGSNDDLCIAKGERVRMADGTDKAVEDVRVGEFVRTPLGGKRVVASGYTGMRRVYRLQAGGRALLATGNHPVATERGWKTLDTVSLVDTIRVSTQRNLLWLFPLRTVLQKLLSSMVASTTATQMLRKLHTGGTTLSVVGGVPCIGTFGNFTMDLSQKGTMSTTKTTIGTTIVSRILGVFQQTNTTKNTISTPRSSAVAQNSLGILKVSDQKQQSGINQQKVGLGIGKTQGGVLGKLGRHLKLPVMNAVKTPCKRTVLFVVKRSLRSLYALSSVQMRARVQAVEETNETLAVYNLSVEDAHCYYVNGILVHNCDTVSMALARFRQGGFISLPSDFKDREYLSRRTTYY